MFESKKICLLNLINKIIPLFISLFTIIVTVIEFLKIKSSTDINFLKISKNWNGVFILTDPILLFAIYLYSCLLVYYLIFERLKKIFEILISTFFIILFSLLTLVFIEKIQFKMDICNIFTKEFLVIVCSFVFLFVIKIKREYHSECRYKEILDRRKKELVYYNTLLSSEKILGIEAEWGSGKSFFVEQLIEERKCKERVININLLLLDTKEIVPLLLKELGNILRKHGLYTIHSRRIKRFFVDSTKMNSSFFDIFEKTTLADNIIEFKESIKDFKEEIIIIFDDLERINDKDKINKILNFGVEFATNNLKVIYIFNQKELEQVDKNVFRKEYIEKFIPCIQTLAPLPFSVLLKHCISEKNMSLEQIKQINPNEYKFIETILNNSISEEKELLGYRNSQIFSKNYLKENIRFEENIDIITMRKVENFIKESQRNLEYIKKNKLYIENQIVISFSFIKFFLPLEFEFFKEKKFKIEDSFDIIFLSEKNKPIKWKELNYIKMWLNRSNIFGTIEDQIPKILDHFDIGDPLETLAGNKEILFSKISNLKLYSKEEDNVIKKILVRIIFNDFLICSNSTLDFFENYNSINAGITSLIYIGDAITRDENIVIYNQISKILEIESPTTINEKIIYKMNNFSHEGYNNVAYLGLPIFKQLINIMVVYGNTEEIKKIITFTIETGNLENFIIASNICLKVKDKHDIRNFIINNFCEAKIEAVEKNILNDFKVLIWRPLIKVIGELSNLNIHILKESLNNPKYEVDITTAQDYTNIFEKIEKIEELNLTGK